MIFSLLYDLGLHLYACVNLPKVALQHRKYKGIFLKRLGVGFPKIEKKGRQLIWIHAVSLGETKAVQPLIKRLKSTENPPLILLSTTTQTGHAEGFKNASMADFHVYLPFDFSYVIRPIIKRTRPDMVILTETDFWYHFQDAAKKVGASLVVINGKISERSYGRLSKLPFLRRKLLGSIDHFYVQGELYRTRFTQLNIPPSKLTLTGNLKLDTEIEADHSAVFKQKLGIKNATILTLGSTHDPEERLWVLALKQLWIQFPQLKVLIVPRHPERFDTVAHLLETQQISFSRLSQGGTLHHGQALLVDAMGVLRQCYQVSDIAFVGGSLTPRVGGHNVLEPAFYGKPVLFGPYMHAQPDLLDLVNTYKSGLQISEETLIPTLRDLLTNPALSHELGNNGQTLIASSRGALERTYNSLQSLLQKTVL